MQMRASGPQGARVVTIVRVERDFVKRVYYIYEYPEAAFL
jgi:hypothetical protein